MNRLRSNAALRRIRLQRLAPRESGDLGDRERALAHALDQVEAQVREGADLPGEWFIDTPDGSSVYVEATPGDTAGDVELWASSGFIRRVEAGRLLTGVVQPRTRRTEFTGVEDPTRLYRLRATTGELVDTREFDCELFAYSPTDETLTIRWSEGRATVSVHCDRVELWEWEHDRETKDPNLAQTAHLTWDGFRGLSLKLPYDRVRLTADRLAVQCPDADLAPTPAMEG